MARELIRAGEVDASPDAMRLVLDLKGLGWPMAVASSSKNANAMMLQIRLGDGSRLVDAFAANDCGRDLPRGPI